MIQTILMRCGDHGIEGDLMRKPILVDTDVLMDFLRGHPQAVALVQRESTHMILSSIAVAELYAGVRGDDEIRVLESFVGLFRVVPVTSDLAKKGGLYKCDYSKSHGVGLADAIIAATADVENAELKTLNVKHYPMFKSLKPAYVKTTGN